MPKGEGKLIAQNKKARHDYSIIDTMIFINWKTAKKPMAGPLETQGKFCAVTPRPDCHTVGARKPREHGRGYTI